jgi:hypothetical protein
VNDIRGGVSLPGTRRFFRVCLIVLDFFIGAKIAMYRFGTHDYSSDDEHWQRVLQKAHANKLHPLCLCKTAANKPGLYVAHLATKYVLKRMPNTGADHSPNCDHYEPPPQLSGLGQVLGAAIREDAKTLVTTLALDFGLTKGKTRAISSTPDANQDSVKSDGTKLTLRGLFDYLYDQAELNRWSPAMAGKRNWYIVRRELTSALMAKQTKGHPLIDLVYIPESYSESRAAEINKHRLLKLARLAETPNARMIFIGEMKPPEEARFGKAIKLKNEPYALLMNDKMGAQFLSRFQAQLQLHAAFPQSHLIVVATVSRSSQGVFLVEAATLINLSPEWIPFESSYEWELLQALLAAGRRYIKGLRYNLPAAKPLASAVLLDTGEIPAALFVVPNNATADFAAAATALAADGKTVGWLWQASSEPMPTFPAKVAYGRPSA